MTAPGAGAPVPPVPAAHVQLMRNPDGRHAVMDAMGNVLGLHNSLASAQRHIQDYYEPQGSQGMAPPNTFQPPVQRGEMAPMAPVHGSHQAAVVQNQLNHLSPEQAQAFRAYTAANYQPPAPAAAQVQQHMNRQREMQRQAQMQAQRAAAQNGR